jgi:hypothetical protein
MGKSGKASGSGKLKSSSTPAAGKPSALLDTRVIYCGDNLEQLAKLPDQSFTNCS